MSMEKRTVEESMIYVGFQKTAIRRVTLVRYPTAERARRGINAAADNGFEALWAIQGRRRSVESILEEGT